MFKYGSFTFSSKFESGNLANVQQVSTSVGCAKLSLCTSCSMFNKLYQHSPSVAPVRKAKSSLSKTKLDLLRSVDVSSVSAKDESKSDYSASKCKPDYEFHLFTLPDCANTVFENGNRTWFYFSISGGSEGDEVALNIMNLNKQLKLYAQGMRPVMQHVSSGAPTKHWRRCESQPHCWNLEGNVQLRWIHKVPPGEMVSYYAFTYPYTYSQLNLKLELIDKKFSEDFVWRNIDVKDIFHAKCMENENSIVDPASSVYYVRELVIKSLDGKRLDLLTISSRTGITCEQEEFLPGLFPDRSNSRPFKFAEKKVIFLSARVHPGETPSSFVLNGFIDFILSEDTRAIKLRNEFVFKIIPMLNPDGVARGHYRSDQRGVNLNRVYDFPKIDLHPTIYAARSLLLYYHLRRVVGDDESSTKPTDENSDVKKIMDPSNIDEDACHGFDDVNDRNSQSGRPCKIFVPSDLDEPSASGCENSNNLSVDSTVHFGRVFKAQEIIDTHDECSNASVFSETNDTGTVDTMIGAPYYFSELQTDVFPHHVSPKLDSPTANESHFNDYLSTSRAQNHKCFCNFNKKKCDCKPNSCENITTVNQNLFPLPTIPDSCKYPSNESCSKTSETFLVPSTFGKIITKSPTFASSNLRESMKKSSELNDSDYLMTSPLVSSSCESKSETFSPPKKNEDAIIAGGKSFLFVKLNDTLSSIDTKYPVEDSGLHMYIDMHGHATKRGIFFYGNWFPDLESMVENLVIAKLLSMNCINFDFNGCNFTQKNMTMKDRKSGQSKEGSGRVAVLRMTGLLRSYTLECNYNTGRNLNRDVTDDVEKCSAGLQEEKPPPYTPAIFEECGREIAVSILDTFQHQSSSSLSAKSRLGASEFRNLEGVKRWLRQFLTSPSGAARSRGHNSLSSSGGASIKVSPLAANSPSRPRCKVSPSSVKKSPRKSSRKTRSKYATVVDAENMAPAVSSSAVDLRLAAAVDVDLGYKASNVVADSCGGMVFNNASLNSEVDESSVNNNKLVSVHCRKKKIGTVRTLSFNESGAATSLYSSKKPKNKVFKKKITKSVNIIDDFETNVAGCSEDYKSVMLIKKVVENARKRKSSEGSKGSSKDICLSPRAPLTCVFEGTKIKSKLQSKRRIKPTRSLSCVVGKSSPEISSSGVKFVGATIFNSDIFLAGTSESVTGDQSMLPSEPVLDEHKRDKDKMTKLKKKKRRKVIPRKSI